MFAFFYNPNRKEKCKKAKSEKLLLLHSKNGKCNFYTEYTKYRIYIWISLYLFSLETHLN